VMVAGEIVQVIRERETVQQLFSGERIFVEGGKA